MGLGVSQELGGTCATLYASQVYTYQYVHQQKHLRRGQPSEVSCVELLWYFILQESASRALGACKRHDACVLYRTPGQ